MVLSQKELLAIARDNVLKYAQEHDMIVLANKGLHVCRKSEYGVYEIVLSGEDYFELWFACQQ